MEDISQIALLKDLSLGVVSVLALAYITLKHNNANKELIDLFVSKLDEREKAMRQVETEVRGSIAKQLAHSSQQLARSAQIIDRAVRHFTKEPK